MSVDWTVGGILGWGSGLALILLAAAVLFVRPVRAVNVGFALFSGGGGLASFLANIVESSDPLRPMLFDLALPTFFVAGAGAVILARRFPRSPELGDRASFLTAAALGALVVGLSLAFLALAPAFVIPGASAALTGAYYKLLVAMSVYRGIDVFLLLALALRYRTCEPGTRRALGVVSAGLVLYPATLAGRALVNDSLASYAGVSFELGVVQSLAILGWAGIWLAHGHRVPEDARATRAVAWIGLAAILLGCATPLSTRLGLDLSSGSLSGLARSGAVALVGIAILRHQALGVDVKIRFAISKSTVAAIFIAVFFIASEAAQQFLGETLGSTYVGIAAAGALVFAMAPLQRAAERLAERAVPVATPAMAEAAAAAPDNENVYRNALRLALRDHALTREEERHLFRLAEALHLDAHRAHELLTEVEREAT